MPKSSLPPNLQLALDACHAAEPAAFTIGQRVRVWYSSARAWKLARVRSICLDLATGKCTYGLECEGRINTHWYKADKLQPVGRGRRS
jgi:hypothetical protein